MTAKPRALVVEDDLEARLAIDRQLDTIGWDAYIANDGSEGLQMMRLELRFDAVLVALQLPDMDGRLVARAAASIRPEARIVFLANRPAAVNRPLLVKPFTTTALAAVLGYGYPR